MCLPSCWTQSSVMYVCSYSTLDVGIVRYVITLLVAYLQVILRHFARCQQSRRRWILADDVLAFFVGVNLVLLCYMLLTQHLMLGIFRFGLKIRIQMLWMSESYVNESDRAACWRCDRPLMLLESICSCIYGTLTQLVVVRIFGILCG